MCYTGKCSWEWYMGNCALNNNIRKKYNLICEMPTCKEELDYIRSEEYQNRLKLAKKENYNL